MKRPKLLPSNTKLKKGRKRYLIAGLALAPADHSGHEVCPHRGACAESCVLWFAGRTVTKPVRDAAINRTKWLFQDRVSFLDRLSAEIHNHHLKACRIGYKPLVRLNAASDLTWESI
jgi:hypothetical protein